MGAAPAPGRYRLRMVAGLDGLQSKPVVKAFAVVRSHG
jgi:hypothetical protein